MAGIQRNNPKKCSKEIAYKNNLKECPQGMIYKNNPRGYYMKQQGGPWKY
jgi:hypothetical protein